MAPSRDVGERPNGNGSTDRLLGELIAEVRTVKHNQRNDSQKLDSVNYLVEQVKDMKAEQERHDVRIAILEADKLRREGAIGLGEWFFRHWPLPFLTALLGAFIAWANNKLRL